MVLAEVDEPPLSVMTEQQRNILGEWLEKYDAKYDVVGILNISDASTALSTPTQHHTTQLREASTISSKTHSAATDEDAAMGLGPDADDFVPAQEFTGARRGYVFKWGVHGRGYYMRAKVKAALAERTARLVNHTIQATEPEPELGSSELALEGQLRRLEQLQKGYMRSERPEPTFVGFYHLPNKKLQRINLEPEMVAFYRV